MSEQGAGRSTGVAVVCACCAPASAGLAPNGSITMVGTATGSVVGIRLCDPAGCRRHGLPLREGSNRHRLVVELAPGVRREWRDLPVRVEPGHHRPAAHHATDAFDFLGDAVLEDRLAALAWSVRPQLAARARTLLGGNVARAREFFLGHPDLQLPEFPNCSVVFPRLPGEPDLDRFVQHVLERHGVALAPGRFFEAPGHFRVSLGGSPELLEQGLQKLGVALADRGWRGRSV